MLIAAAVASLQIVWSGPGRPAAARANLPAIISSPPAGQRPSPPVRFGLIYGNSSVGGDWTASPLDTVTFTDTDPAGYTAQSTETFARPQGEFRGPVTIRASYANIVATLPAFVYPSTAVSCYMGFQNGARFDDVGIAQTAGHPQESDIFVTGPQNGPANAFRGCTGAFVDPRTRQYPIHVPYGGTVIRAGRNVYFGDVSVRDWHYDFTQTPVLRPGDILLFKLRDGRVVKLLVYPFSGGELSGAYLTGPPRGDFQDYVIYHHVKPHVHALFGHQ